MDGEHLDNIVRVVGEGGSVEPEGIDTRSHV